MKFFGVLAVILTSYFFYSCSPSVDDDDIIYNEQVDSLAVIILNVTNIEEFEGGMNIALYDSKNSFETDISSRLTENEYAFEYPDVTTSSLSVTFEDVVAGDYAFSIYHDEDGDREMDLVAGLFPKEPYGFSNNYRPTFSAPDFEDCDFRVNYYDSLVVEINLIQP